jgi:acyl-CoA synthetase (AMP-forming)/AMP-acid ligase II
VAFLLERFRASAQREAIVWRDQSYRYADLLASYAAAHRQVGETGIPEGTVVSLEADFSPNTIGLLLALIERGSTIVPLTSSVEAKKPEFRQIAEVEVCASLGANDALTIASTDTTASHSLIRSLKDKRRPGLVLFSSGSTGKNKAALHDLVPLLEKFKTPRQTLRTMAFLLFDHIGGINTLFYTLANAGCVVVVENRSPDSVCRAVAAHRVELLPTSPTFLNLLLVSEAYRRHDLSSLKLVTYGTEVMPESTLRRCHELLPHVTLQQTYGLSEVGILRSKSRSSDSLWVKIGGEGFETRVVDGLLEIKAQSAMLGYLNATSPFTDDGWFKTGDAVEVDGEWVRILGRRSEIVNVGGEKVYPAEVESVLQLMSGVEEVLVRSEANALTGQIVVATVKLSTVESLADFRRRMRDFCSDKLPRFKVPQKVVLTTREIHGERFKKIRRGDDLDAETSTTAP